MDGRLRGHHRLISQLDPRANTSRRPFRESRAERFASSPTPILLRSPRLLQAPRYGSDSCSEPCGVIPEEQIVPIPKILHQIWIGPRPAPLRWTQTWREMNPDFTYRLWDEDAIESFGLRNREIYRRYLLEGLYDGAADIARAEILERFGGVYVDADSVALRPLGKAQFLKAGFFAQREPNDYQPEMITNAFMGAIPHHPVLVRYIDALSQISALRPMWRVAGPGALTGVLAAQMEADVLILPWWTFFTALLKGEEDPIGEPYAQHFWSTTAERWGYERATPYPRAEGANPSA